MVGGSRRERRNHRRAKHKNGVALHGVDATPFVALPALDLPKGSLAGRTSPLGGSIDVDKPPVKVSGAPGNVVGVKVPHGPYLSAQQHRVLSA